MQRSLLILVAMLLASPICPAWDTGDSMPFPQCSSTELMIQDTDFRRFYNLIYYDRAYGRGSNWRFAITCTPLTGGSGGTIYVIDPQYDSATKTIAGYKVARVIRSDDPAKLLVEHRSASDTRSLVIDVYPLKNELLLYSQEKTPSCPSSAELKTIVLALPMPKSNAVPVGSGICVQASAHSDATGGGVTAMNILDYAAAEDGTARIVVYEEKHLLVLEYSPGGKLTLRADFRGPELFPGGCGHYLTGARLVPPTRIALSYRTPMLSLVDYAKPEQKPQVLYDFDAVMKGKELAFTCEGGSPNYGRDRQRLWISPSTQVKGTIQKLYFLAFDAN